MSGKIVNNVFRASGVIAPTAGGLSWSSAVITGSTLTASAGNGYFINTTSNACTVTLPSSPEIGDQIVFADYARTWATNNLIIDSNGNNFQGESDLYTVDYSTAGQSLNIVYSDATKGWLPVSDDAVANVPVAPPTQRAVIYAGNFTSTVGNTSNLVSSSGTVSSDVTGVGTARSYLAGANYGGDKAIFAYGSQQNGTKVNVSNLVTNQGVVGSDVTGVGTARISLDGSTYGGDKAIFFGGNPGSGAGKLINLVSNQGVVASDTSASAGVSNSDNSAAAQFGTGQAIFAYNSSVSNIVLFTGVIANDVSRVGTNRGGATGAGYGGDKGIFFGGNTGGQYGFIGTTNLVSNTGVVGSDVSAVGSARAELAGSQYGGDKAVLAFGMLNGYPLTNLSNKISNQGVVASDTSGVGTARNLCRGAGYSFSA